MRLQTDVCLCSQLRAYEHYIPVRLDYADLVSQLDWARSHEEQVLRLAEDAGNFADKYLKDAHMRSYWYRCGM